MNVHCPAPVAHSVMHDINPKRLVKFGHLKVNDFSYQIASFVVLSEQPNSQLLTEKFMLPANAESASFCLIFVVINIICTIYLFLCYLLYVLLYYVSLFLWINVFPFSSSSIILFMSMSVGCSGLFIYCLFGL